MGYTHYFSQHRAATAPEWKALTKAVKAIIAATNAAAPVQYEYDVFTPALIDDATIHFNGIGDDGHETFVLNRKVCDKLDYEDRADFDKDGVFDFCKTAHKPYDIVVTATLLAAQVLAPDVWDVSSDGDDRDWRHGLRVATKILGDGINLTAFQNNS